MTLFRRFDDETASLSHRDGGLDTSTYFFFLNLTLCIRVRMLITSVLRLYLCISIPVSGRLRQLG